jgi:hypothetical protein
VLDHDSQARALTPSWCRQDSLENGTEGHRLAGEKGAPSNEMGRERTRLSDSVVLKDWAS